MKRSEVRKGGQADTQRAVNQRAANMARLAFGLVLGCLVAATAEADVPAHLQMSTASWDDRDADGKEVQGHASFRTGSGALRQCDGKSEVVAIRFNRRTAPLINQVQSGRPLDLAQQVKAAVTDGLRKTVCDAKGDFRFESMAAGFWYVWTQLPLAASEPAANTKTIAETTIGTTFLMDSASATKTATGVLATFVVVSSGKTNDVDLSADVVKLWPTWTETR
ncbi:hypothetical protein ACFPL7_05420 [Dongia soli]|uniref:Uncharacterized protein n=1 Tax=Dongia soli TaxID=600628 RepID=A0ABU5EFQ1_9PROT|nr:hypothetical protein [Dongia soli]MDY0884839.1 hypothetical protein [Dongia soli]